MDMDDIERPDHVVQSESKPSLSNFVTVTGELPTKRIVLRENDNNEARPNMTGHPFIELSEYPDKNKLPNLEILAGFETLQDALNKEEETVSVTIVVPADRVYSARHMLLGNTVVNHFTGERRPHIPGEDSDVFDMCDNAINAVFPSAELLGHGRDGAVYDIGEGKVIKMLFQEPFIDNLSDRELYTNKMALQTGSFIVPETIAVEINGQKGLLRDNCVVEDRIEYSKNRALTRILEGISESVAREVFSRPAFKDINRVKRARNIIFNANDIAESFASEVSRLELSPDDHPILKELSRPEVVQEIHDFLMKMTDKNILVVDLSLNNFGLKDGHVKLLDMSRVAIQGEVPKQETIQIKKPEDVSSLKKKTVEFTP